MAVQVLLPKLGLTMQEGTIEEWLVPTGQEVRPGDPILRLTTDKVDVDVEAEAAGHLYPVVAAGATVEPGVVIAWLLDQGEEPPSGVLSGERPAATGAAVPARTLASPNARRLARDHGVQLATVRGSGPNGRIVSEDVEAVVATREAASATSGAAANDGAALALTAPLSPLVRRHARALGVDLADVTGSGPGGRIRREDVDAAATDAVNGPPDGTPGIAVARTVPLSGMRGTIARRMHASLQEMAQLTHAFEVRMDGVTSVRDQLKAEWGSSGLALPSLNDFIVLAAAQALRDHPGLNAGIVGEQILEYRDIHVGVAVAVPDGLLVPVVRDAADRTLTGLAAKTRTLATAAREGRLALADLEGATFVVTSLGGYGVDFFTPIVNPGNVAILGVGRLRDGVRWEGEVPRRSQVLTLSLTFDHRAVDGAPAAEYLKTVAGLLEQPLRLLAGHD